jgi:CubicO group peptidase (beta-lactamase class C family)
MTGQIALSASAPWRFAGAAATIAALRNPRCAPILLMCLASAGVAAAAPESSGAGPAAAWSAAYPPARFEDPERATRLQSAVPELDRIFREWREREPAPSVVYGLVMDGALVHAAAFGERDTVSHAKATVDSVYRIASMTKSFTALAILRLRDDGRLRLDDPVDKYVPELAGLAYPTSDSPKLTIRLLLSHAGGFPEDNPWGDRQLAIPAATFAEWLRAGIPFSHAPGTGFEYSNYGFMILGRVVTAASGHAYRNYVDATVIRPLGMAATTWDEKKVPPDRRAIGQRPDGTEWLPEVALADGAGGAMGGLYSSIPDLARYVAYFLDAYPPRDGAELGPARRATRREMQMPMTPYRMSAQRASVTQPLEVNSGGYAFGLGVLQSCRFGQIVSHAGGLPGFGSRMTWLPEYGVGIVAVSNRTYAALRPPVNAALEALARTGALKPRIAQPSAALIEARRSIDALYGTWNDAALERIAADNLLLDRSMASRRKDFADAKTKVGACEISDPSVNLDVENPLRGTWALACAHGRVRIAVTLAPTPVPGVQRIELTPIVDLDPALAPVAAELAAHVGGHLDRSLTNAVAAGADVNAIDRELAAARPWGVCRAGKVSAGDGRIHTTLRLECERGPLDLAVEWDADRPEIKALSLAPPPEEICVP